MFRKDFLYDYKWLPSSIFQRQRIESERVRERILEEYRLHSKKEEKRTEEIYLEEKNFETPKNVGKLCQKTKELEFGGKIGMIVLERITCNCILFLNLPCITTHVYQ